METEIVKALSIVSSFIAIIPWIYLTLKLKNNRNGLKEIDIQMSGALEYLFKGMTIVALVHAAMTLATLAGLEGETFHFIWDVKNFILNIGLGGVGVIFYRLYKQES